MQQCRSCCRIRGTEVDGEVGRCRTAAADRLPHLAVEVAVEADVGGGDGQWREGMDLDILRISRVSTRLQYERRGVLIGLIPVH